MQGFVVGSQEPSRLALVPQGDLEGPANDVAEFAHVPRPGVAQKDFSCPFRDLAAGPPELHVGFHQKTVRQVEDVVSLSEGWQGDQEFVQAIASTSNFVGPYTNRDGESLSTERPAATWRYESS